MPAALVFLLFLTSSWAIAQQTSFLPAEQCLLCHRLVPGNAGDGNKLGAPVGHHPAWKSSMMAHASLDPYWLAKIEAEKAQHPAAPVSVDAVCMRCHAPAQAKTAELAGKPVSVTDIDRLGKDGVSCLVCHQILPDRLGATASFTGQPFYSPELVAFGPHAKPFAMPMLHHTGVSPSEGKHILESALCGSCHTVITPTLDAQGKVVGEFLEQSPYLEWLASGMPAERSCQSCHTPKARTEENEGGRYYIAHNPMGRTFPPTAERSPFGVHSFAGGNAAMLSFFKQETGSAAGLNASVERTRQNLRRAASLHIEPLRDGGALSLQVTIRNHTGHKLPTGFPSRRVWLHLTVSDAAGNTLFESGSFDPQTNDILTADGAVNDGLQPHLNEITSQEQVALYETELANLAGARTHSLLSASRFHKDNRLLPPGFDIERRLPEGLPRESLIPVGVQGDSDFQAGSDTVKYTLPGNIAESARTVRVELLFQSIKPSHLAALRDKAGPETDRTVATLSAATEIFVIANSQASLEH